MDEHTTDGRMNKHMDVQRETIIPHHFCVAGYKNYKIALKSQPKSTDIFLISS